MTQNADDDGIDHDGMEDGVGPGGFDVDDWTRLAPFTGRVATLEDVQAHRAVFALADTDAPRPLDMPLPQILNTLWFELHVVVAFFGYALFAVGALASAAHLFTGNRGYLDLLYKTALTGWTFFSASMISGGIWGYYAWGTYWLWTPKELWTSILWLFYALLLHVRLKGPRWDLITAWLGVAGVFVMLFTYLGVSMLMKSSHSF